MGILIGLLRMIIELIFNSISLLILLRFLLQCVKANFYHPIIQILTRITNPLLLPVRRVTPVLGSWDWSCILLVIILGLIKYTLIILLYRIPFPPLNIFMVILADILRQIIHIYLFAYIVLSLMSWLGNSPKLLVLTDLLKKLTDPLSRRLKFNLRYEMIDLKPMAICFILFVMLIILGAIRNALIV